MTLHGNTRLNANLVKRKFNDVKEGDWVRYLSEVEGRRVQPPKLQKTSESALARAGYGIGETLTVRQRDPFRHPDSGRGRLIAVTL